MPSKAYVAFKKNAKDISRLLELHKDSGGIAKGRRYGLEVLNKSAVVLLTSIWEAYCEDIVAEALEHVVTHATAADMLPEELRKLIAKDLKMQNHELAIWQLADAGWRTVLKDRLAALQAERNRRLNTPKAIYIDAMFLNALGIPRISDRWRWTKMSAARARLKLDSYVELRGAIAHRGAAASSVKKSHVVDYFKHIRHLVSLTGGAVNKHVRSISNVRLWN